jgi:hypothetical protein
MTGKANRLQLGDLLREQHPPVGTRPKPKLEPKETLEQFKAKYSL